MTEPQLNAAAPGKFAHRLFWFGLALYLLVLPVQHTIALRNVALALILIATVAHLLPARQWPQMPLRSAWIAYTAVALASLAYAISPLDSFSEIRVEIFYGIALFFTAVTWSRQPGALAGISYLLAITNVIFVAAALSKVNLSTGEQVSLNLSFFAKAGVNSNFLLTILPLIAHRAWQDWRDQRRALSGLLGALILLDLLALLLSYNRQSFVALGAGILCAGLLILRFHFSWRRLAAFLAVVLLAAALAGWSLTRRAGTSAPIAQVAKSAFTQDVRPELWKFSLERIGEHPLSGGGFGRNVFEKMYPEFKPDDINLWHAHNMVINKGIQMGIPGMLAFLYLWYCVAARFRSALGKAPPDHALAVTGLTVVAMVFVKNMTDDFFVRDMQQLFWLLIGALMGGLSAGQRRGAKTP